MDGLQTLHTSGHRTRTRQPVLWALLPVTVLYLLFFVFPMLVMGLVSFLQVREFEIIRQFTLRNYAFFLGSKVYLRVLWKTVLLALGVTGLSLIIGYPLAYYLTKVSKVWQRTFLAMIILPFWTSYLLRVYAWMSILGESGFINRALVFLGVLREPVQFLLYNMFAVVLVSLYLQLPYSVLALYTALEGLDLSLINAATDLGANPVQTFRHVTFPLVLPGLLASFVFVFIPVLGEYATPTLVGGTDGILIVNIIVSQLRALRFGIAAAMTILILGIVFVVLCSLGRVVRLERIFGTGT